MAEYLIQDSTLTEIADAIRDKINDAAMIDAADMAEKINSIAIEEYTIEVTVDSGATVTVTNGTKTYTGTSNGVCVIKVNDTGSWTCSATLNGVQSNTKIVNVYNDFATTLIFFTAPVMINTSEGVTVTATKGETVLTQTVPSTGVVSFVIRDPGEWTFKAEKDGKSLSETINIVNEETYSIYLSIDLLILNFNSWEKISEISQAGTAKNYWSIGDCKAVTLSGTMGTLALDTTLWLYILGFDHNAEKEGYGITFGGFKTAAGADGIDVGLVDSYYRQGLTDGTKAFNMNHWGNYNYGGWARSDARYDILGSTDVAPQGYGAKATSGQVGYAPSSNCATSPVADTLMSCLPADLRAVMKPITKYTDNVGGGTKTETNVSAMVDYLPLLAEFEIFGSRFYANKFEQNYQLQYEYYSAGNSKVKYKHSATGSTAYWWGRSPHYNNTTYFCHVNENYGNAYRNHANLSYGVAPALLV